MTLLVAAITVDGAKLGPITELVAELSIAESGFVGLFIAAKFASRAFS